MAVLTLGILAAALWVLRKSLAGLHWQTVLDHLRALPPMHIAIAAGFAAVSYGMLTLYDFLAVRFVGGRLHWRQVAPISFTAYAFGHNLGISVLSGGALRLRGYGRLGLSSVQVAGVIALCAIAFGMGCNVLLDLALLLEPQLAAQILTISPDTARLLGLANAALLLLWLWFTCGRKKPLRLAGHDFPTPSYAFSGRQIVVAVMDLAASSAAFYWLLPAEAPLTYPAFAGCYVLAMAAGIASNVPGGLGVFESVLLLTMPGVARVEIVGAALAFRVVYYLLPFTLALLLLAARELPALLGRCCSSQGNAHG